MQGCLFYYEYPFDFAPPEKEDATPKNATMAKQTVKFVALKRGERSFKFLCQATGTLTANYVYFYSRCQRVKSQSRLCTDRYRTLSACPIHSDTSQSAHGADLRM